MTKKQTSITIREVAAQAGVSVATVSRYLNQKTVVSPEISARLTQVMAELNYQPQAAARHLASSRTQTVGFLLLNFSMDYFGPLLNGIEAVARDQEYNLLVATSKTATQEQPLSVGPHNTDGLIVFADLSAEKQVEKLSQANFPLVVIYAAPKNGFHFLQSPLAASRTATRQVGQAAAEQLFNLITGKKVEQEILLPAGLILRSLSGRDYRVDREHRIPEKILFSAAVASYAP